MDAGHASTSDGMSADAAVRLRCLMKDCPGELGRVVCSHPVEGQSSWEYQAPRGFVQKAERLWAESPRARRFRRREWGLHGRRHHKGVSDWNRERPLRPWEMPGETWGLDDGQPVCVECNVCARPSSFSKSHAQRFLDMA